MQVKLNRAGKNQTKPDLTGQARTGQNRTVADTRGRGSRPEDRRAAWHGWRPRPPPAGRTDGKYAAPCPDIAAAGIPAMSLHCQGYWMA